jgi:hypothetical protein
MPRRRPTHLLRLAATFAVALGVAGCTTPSFPVPPPEPDAIVFTVGDGSATFSADPIMVWANATVTVFDETSGYGVIVPALDDGSVPETDPFIGQDGDRVVVTYELPEQVASMCLILHDGRSSPAFRCE